MTARLPWSAALAFALTGETPVGAAPGLPQPDSFWAWLSDAGWPPERVAELARRRGLAGEPWPLPLPRRWAAVLTAPAQFYALLAQMRRRLPVSATTQAGRPGPGVSPEERRLRDEVPPHFGHFG